MHHFIQLTLEIITELGKKKRIMELLLCLVNNKEKLEFQQGIELKKSQKIILLSTVKHITIPKQTRIIYYEKNNILVVSDYIVCKFIRTSWY